MGAVYANACSAIAGHVTVRGPLARTAIQRPAWTGTLPFRSDNAPAASVPMAARRVARRAGWRLKAQKLAPETNARDLRTLVAREGNEPGDFVERIQLGFDPSRAQLQFVPLTWLA